MKLNAARRCNLFCLQLLRREDLKKGECTYLKCKSKNLAGLCVLFPVSYDDLDPRCWKTRTIHHNPYISFLLLSLVPTRGIMWPDKTEECSARHHMGQSVWLEKLCCLFCLNWTDLLHPDFCFTGCNSFYWGPFRYQVEQRINVQQFYRSIFNSWMPLK